GSARALRDHARHVPVDLATTIIDTCGTGGDQSGTFNVSTTVAFVVAAAGVKVAKHGNRASSSLCGSADVLEALGVRIELSPEGVCRCIEEVGVGFMFAPAFHPAMKHVAAIRLDLKVRSIFNLLGPLVNPARVERQLVGVFAPDLTETIAHVLHRLGSKRAMVVSGYGGLDELTITGLTHISELSNEEVRTYDIDPRSLGLRTASVLDLQGGNAQENADILKGILEGAVKDVRRDMILLNSAAALLIGEAVDSMPEGIELASNILDTGRAAEKLRLLIKISQESAA
ncbi:MAG: anthranilate phosphoribosyltransferase, partial [Bdellovibrionales bacterium]|nr:anthranilate phosphoribosyltransferase [Bdellovibrionales bacterium]